MAKSLREQAPRAQSERAWLLLAQQQRAWVPLALGYSVRLAVQALLALVLSALVANALQAPKESPWGPRRMVQR
jgi:hypothetical protein